MREFSFGNLLASFRIRLGYLQKQIAEDLEISLRTFQGWENGGGCLLTECFASLRPIELNQAEADILYRAAGQVPPSIPKTSCQYHFLRDFSFGKLLASYRVRTGHTQKQVIHYLNDKLKQKESKVTERTYQSWEGKKAIPDKNKVEVLQYLTNLFELDEGEIDQLYRAAAQVAPEIQNLPFPRNAYFTGRETYPATVRSFKEGSCCSYPADKY